MLRTGRLHFCHLNKALWRVRADWTVPLQWEFAWTERPSVYGRVSNKVHRERGVSEAAITCKFVLTLSGWESERKAIHQTVSTCNLSSTKIASIRGWVDVGVLHPKWQEQQCIITCQFGDCLDVECPRFDSMQGRNLSLWHHVQCIYQAYEAVCSVGTGSYLQNF